MYYSVYLLKPSIKLKKLV